MTNRAGTSASVLAKNLLTKACCYFFITILVVLFLSGCAGRSNNEYTRTNIPLPPSPFIRSNYEQASQVVAMKLAQHKIERIIYADSGAPGYIVIKESGAVIKTYKGIIKPGQQITYYDWIEFQPQWKKSRPDKALVFLKQDKKTGRYHTIGECAVFPYSKEIDRMVDAIEAEYSPNTMGYDNETDEGS